MYIIIASCADCKKVITNKKVSPDGKHIAIAYWQDCGAIANGQPQISILTLQDTSLETYGNIVKDDYSVWIDRWSGPDTLILKLEYSKYNMDFREEKFNGITIVFQNGKPPN